MASSEKKRVREQNAAARRDRVLQKRSEKSALPGEAPSPVRTGIAARFAELEPTADPDS